MGIFARITVKSFMLDICFLLHTWSQLFQVLLKTVSNLPYINTEETNGIAPDDKSIYKDIFLLPRKNTWATTSVLPIHLCSRQSPSIENLDPGYLISQLSF